MHFVCYVYISHEACKERARVSFLIVRKKMEAELHLCIIIADVLKICRSIVSSSSAKPHAITPFCANKCVK